MKSPRAIIVLAALISLAMAHASLAGSRKTTAKPKKHSESYSRLSQKRKSAYLPVEAGEQKHQRDDSPAEAARFFLQKRLGKRLRELPTQKYIEAAERIKKMPVHSTARESHNLEGVDAASARRETDTNLQPGLETWTPLGPGNIGGRTRALLIDPTAPSIMYAAGVGGGVWKSVDGGSNWSPLTDMVANIAVTTLAMDPSNHNVLYAGTGEGYSNIDSIPGVGIFKSTDAGSTWTHLPSTIDSYFHYIFKIVISPNDPQRIYVATSMGIWMSAAGQPFTPVFFTQDGCSDLVIRTDQPTDYLYAACGLFEPVTIYRNTGAQDGQYSGWRPLFSPSNMGRTSLALAPSDQNTIYAMGMQIGQDHDHDFALKAVYRSTRSGDPATWTLQSSSDNPTKLNTLLLTNPLAATSELCGQGPDFYVNQGWYDSVLAVDPVNPNKVWAGGIDLFRSDDAGVSWGLASYWWSEGSPQYVHADQHVIVFHPQYNGTSNKTMFVTNDGGLYRTDDALAATANGPMATCNPANSALTWTNANNGYAVTQFYQGAAFPGGSEFFGGTQDNGIIKGSLASGQNWNQVLSGDGGFVKVNPQNTSILYASNPGLSIHKSVDGGANWTKSTNGIQDFGLFVTPFDMDPTNPNRLWTGGAYLWRTDNSAGSWQQASTLTAGNGLVSAIAVSASDPNLVVVGMSDGWVLTTTQGTTAGAGTEWSSRFPRTGFVSSVAFDPINNAVIYATYSTLDSLAHAHVYKSVDGGNNWQSLDGSGSEGIPDIPVNSIAINPADSSRLYVGTDSGVFVSLDGGLHWAFENTGFANVVTEALQVEPSSESLFAFTHGRGAWKVALQPQALRVTPALLDFGLQFRNRLSTALAVQLTNVSESPVNVTNVSADSNFVQSTACGTLAAGASCTISVTVTPSLLGSITGTLTISFTGPGGSFSVPLRATGYTGPVVNLSPAAVDFGSVDWGTTSNSRRVVLTNTGDSDLHISSVATDGISGLFSRQNRCPVTVAPGNSCNINIRVTAESGNVNGQLNINSDAATNPDKVMLSFAYGAQRDLFSVPQFMIKLAGDSNRNLQIYVNNNLRLSPATVLRIDGQNRPTDLRGLPFQINATLTADDLAQPGQHRITLYDPAHAPQETPPGWLLVQLLVPVSRIVFDPYAQLIFGAPALQPVSGGMPGLPDPNPAATAAALAINKTVFVINANTGTIVRKLLIPNVVNLSLSADGKYMFALGGFGKTVYRYYIQRDIIDKTFDVTAATPNSPNNTAMLAVVPPTDDLSLVTTTWDGGIYLFNNGVPSTNAITTFGRYAQLESGDTINTLLSRDADGNLLPFGNTPSSAYGIDYFGAYHQFRIDPLGITDVKTGNLPPFANSIKFDSGVIYTGNGYALDPTSLQSLGTYESFNSGGADRQNSNMGTPFPNAASGTVQYVGDKLWAFNMKSFDLLTELPSPFASGSGIVKPASDSFISVNNTGYVTNTGLLFYRDPLLNPYQAPLTPSSITGLSPASVTSQSENLLLQITGTGFTPGSFVMWNGQKRTTSYSNSNSLIAYIPASDLALPGTADVSVGNPETLPSAPIQFTINTSVVTVQPRALRFGTTISNRKSAWQEVSVANNGTTSIAIGQVWAMNDRYSSWTDCPSQLGAGSACRAAVSFAPLATGDQYGTLNIQAGNNAAPISIPLSGNGFDFTLNLSRPTRPHRNGGGQAASASREAVQISLGGSTLAGSAQVRCTVPSKEFSCKVSPQIILIGGPAVTATVSLENYHTRRLRTGSRPFPPVTITATSQGVTLNEPLPR